jgi:hypothetical protein
MEEIAYRIASIIGDYENNEMTVEHVLRWVEQFEKTDREFILKELEGIFLKCYLSKEQCLKFLKEYIEYLSSYFKYDRVAEFLNDTQFLDLQKEEKSQHELLALMDRILQSEYGITVKNCGKNPKYYLYLDDVLATGNKVFTELSVWLKTVCQLNNLKNNYEYIKERKLNVLVCFFCLHTWGRLNAEFRLMKELDDTVRDYVKFFRNFEVQNQIKAHNPRLNLMIPIEEGQPSEVINYLNSLEATANADRAYRKANQPVKEEFFSSPENRVRLENIFLKKGVELLQHVKNLSVKQIRPLGYTIKSHKTFGLGTLFFTYRNIPNNCPIVFWWGNNWYPLFKLKNRGKKVNYAIT